MKRWIDLGYHIESADGRKNSALSDASAQNHIQVVTHLLELGCDPNKSSDTGRTPLWSFTLYHSFSFNTDLLTLSGEVVLMVFMKFRCCYWKQVRIQMYLTK